MDIEASFMYECQMAMRGLGINHSVTQNHCTSSDIIVVEKQRRRRLESWLNLIHRTTRELHCLISVQEIQVIIDALRYNKHSTCYDGQPYGHGYKQALLNLFFRYIDIFSPNGTEAAYTPLPANSATKRKRLPSAVEDEDETIARQWFSNHTSVHVAKPNTRIAKDTNKERACPTVGKRDEEKQLTAYHTYYISPVLSPNIPTSSSTIMVSTSALLLALGPLLAAAASADCKRVCTTVHNDCGQPFRSCYNPCNGKPMVPPPCTTPAPVPTTVDDDCHSRTICIDYINSCGIMYGT
ncbi:hypothetical protein L249_3122 [Ophiocordyceps polyrhachis-furcata BCC 54312]|uniref:Uncharacterized protein n=1 Tax=Ophiocordyceps polyrhachis-furcata BCC 54312 TaxID=1330021 RepID=A0A367LPV8_9HYPO|nr:hypothetical protein L249_3122 [Ophiocordyceps polyrhachis-furcata BCC 54312]